MNRSLRVFNFACTVIASIATARFAQADQPPAVDVVVQDAARPSRPITVEWNPLPLMTIGKLSANVVFVPIDHNALIVSPFFAWTTTNPIYVYDDAGNATQLPTQSFKGFGSELGYRYYFGKGGPRGFFVGPSLIVASFNATAQNGSETQFFDLGLAADAGYEVLIADRLALSLGGGVQYTTPTKSIPDQQFPAEIYANRGFRPRVLVALGWAF
jgi:hypothetical protein